MSQPDVGQLLAQARQMQERMQTLQRELAARRVEGSAGGGMVVAVAGYFWQTGKFYYVDPPRGRQAPDSLQRAAESQRIHPFYGFTLAPGKQSSIDSASGKLLATNNLGFYSDVDYPVTRSSPDEILVGIFGGSVAAQLAVFETEHAVFREALARRLDLEPRLIQVLNFAQGGFKQPQQALILAYVRSLGQELDLVVNCDGFNEVVLAGRNVEAGIAIDMPSIDHVRVLQDVTSFGESVDGVERMLRVRSHWARYASRYNRAWAGEAAELRLASGFLFHWVLYEIDLRRYERARLAAAPSGDSAPSADGGSWLYLAPTSSGRAASDFDAIFPAAVELWSRSSRLMAGIQSASGAAYLHVVQPNQYHETSRAFSPDEEAVAFSKQSRYGPLARRGYGPLVEEVGALQESGVSAEDLTTIFDEIDGPVYADDCCHYTGLGQRVVLKAIADLAAPLLLP